MSCPLCQPRKDPPTATELAVREEHLHRLVQRLVRLREMPFEHFEAEMEKLARELMDANLLD